MALKINRNDRDYVPEWKGNRELPASEQIGITYKTLRISDMFAVQKVTNVNLMGGFEIDQDDPDSIANYWGLVQEVLSKYVIKWRGVIIDGTEVTDPKEVLDSLGTGHMELLGEIFSTILAESSGTVDEEKNSEPESEPQTADSDGDAEPALLKDSVKSETVVEPTQIQETEVATT